MILKALTTTFLMFFMFTAMAGEVEIIKIFNDSANDDFDYKFVGITSSSGDLVKFEKRYFLKGTQFKKPYADRTKVFKVPSSSGAKIVLEKISGFEITALVSDSFEPVYGGSIKLVYLTNYLSGNKQSISFDIVRVGQSAKWVLKQNGQVKTQLKLITNKKLGMEVGVKEVQI